jgi:branched-chain amino acid transport system substrate-binding protein
MEWMEPTKEGVLQRWRITGLVALAAAALGVGACGDDKGGDSAGGGGGAKTLTVYSSLPLQGDSRPQNQDVVRGIKLALEKSGGKAGQFKIKYVSLDDATASAGKWEPGQTSQNARKAAGDDATIAYIGEFNSGATAISLPLLNDAGILQVSPSNTAIGLTRSEGADKGEPDKYYPSGKRTYGRVVPADHIQAAAQVTYQKEEGVTKLYILNDKEVYGKGLADQVARLAPAQGIKVLGNDGIDTKAANFRALAQKVADSGADGFFFGGITQNKGVQVFKDVAASNPGIKMFGPDGVAESAFSEKLGSGVEKNTFITNPTLDPKLYPAAGQDFIKQFKAKYGKDPEPYAIYGFEAMSVVLDAIKRAGDKAGDRKAVVDAFFQTKGRQSVLGTYDIDENGDTTLSDYGGNKIQGGKLVFDKVIKAQASQ